MLGVERHFFCAMARQCLQKLRTRNPSYAVREHAIGGQLISIIDYGLLEITHCLPFTFPLGRASRSEDISADKPSPAVTVLAWVKNVL